MISLSENFLAVKDYRNDVMHAHNIDSETFREARKLFTTINKQLDAEIGLIIKKAEEHPEETADSEFNEALNTAIAAQNASSLLKYAQDSLIELSSIYPDGMRELLRQLQEYYAPSVDYVQIQTAMKPILDLYTGSEYAQLQNTLREFAAYQGTEEYDALRKQIREITGFAAALRNSMGLTQPKKKDDKREEARDSGRTEETTETEEGINNG